MARGGARSRSGPQPDPDSLTSARRGLTLGLLPREGHPDPAPAFPLPKPSDRELEVWAQSWALPQGAAWAKESWRWRTIAQWVRWSVRMEAHNASASLGTVVLRLADQIGLTPAGLKENGWAVSKDELQLKREQEPPVDERPAGRKSSARDRMTVVDDASTG